MALKVASIVFFFLNILFIKVEANETVITLMWMIVGLDTVLWLI